MDNFRSNCPLNRALELLGDKWTLLVVRDTTAHGKTTFKQLAAMPEGIATNILTDRLHKLVAEGILTKTRDAKNKLVFHYSPTEKALTLFPAAMELANWSRQHLYTDGAEPTSLQLPTETAPTV